MMVLSREINQCYPECMNNCNKNDILVLKLLYFLHYAGFAAWTTYFYVYLKQDGGLSGFQIGILASIQQFTTMLFLPAWGIVADKKGKKLIFLISLALSIVMLQGFMASGSFFMYLLFVILMYVACSPLTSLLDSVAIEMSEQHGGQISYGELRLWASIGWALSSAVTGFVVKSGSMSVIFPIATVLLATTWFISFFFQKPSPPQVHHENISMKSVFELLAREKRLFAFFILILFFYVFNAPIMLFINLYYNEIGANNYHIGLAIAVQAVCELPFFFWGQKLVEMYGAKRLIFFTMIVAAIRMFLYGMISNPWFAVAVGASHGVTLGLFMVATIAFAHKLIPAHLRTTGQSLIYMFLGLGTCIGNFMVGYMKDTISIKSAMIIDAALILLLVAVASILLRMRRHTGAVQRRFFHGNLCTQNSLRETKETLYLPRNSRNSNQLNSQQDDCKRDT